MTPQKTWIKHRIRRFVHEAVDPCCGNVELLTSDAGKLMLKTRQRIMFEWAGGVPRVLVEMRVPVYHQVQEDYQDAEEG